MKRMDLLYKLDGLLEQCKTCEKKPRNNEKASEKCKGCQVYSQIRWIGENLGRKKEMAKISLEEYQDYKAKGLPDKEIAEMKGLNPQYLSQLKKKWSIRTVLGAAAEKKPSECNCIKNDKVTEYEHLYKELEEKLNHSQKDNVHQRKLIDQLQDKVKELEFLHSACDDVENELDNVREEKERLLDENNLLINENRKLDTIIENQKYQLGQYAKENGELQEENEKLKYFALKYLAV